MEMWNYNEMTSAIIKVKLEFMKYKSTNITNQ